MHCATAPQIWWELFGAAGSPRYWLHGMVKSSHHIRGLPKRGRLKLDLPTQPFLQSTPDPLQLINRTQQPHAPFRLSKGFPGAYDRLRAVTTPLNPGEIPTHTANTHTLLWLLLNDTKANFYFTSELCMRACARGSVCECECEGVCACVYALACV